MANTRKRKDSTGDALTRSDLAKSLYYDIGAHGDSYEFVGAFFDALREVVSADEPVVIHNFGKFRCLDKSERLGRNPRTGEAVTITPRRVVSFIASNKFKNKLRDYDNAE